MKFKKFIKREVKRLKIDLLGFLVTIPIVVVFSAILALPGAIIAFLCFGFNTEALVFGGSLSVIIISLMVRAISRIKEFIKEHKSFNEDKC